MKKRIALAFVIVLALVSSQAFAQTKGYWSFEEGSFQPDCPGSPPHNAGGHVVDWSGLGNHGCLENPFRNVKYTTDAYAGTYALHLNDPADAVTKFLSGYVFVPHNTTLEPPTGMIEAQVKITDYPGTIAPGASTLVFAKSTFQLLRTEPGPIPIFCCIDGNPRIIGRTVYQLEILSDGRLRATVANDDPLTPGAPWRVAESGAALTLDAWNQIAMKWDGCQVSAILNGSQSGVPYDPVPVLGLSYQGTGYDPTYGAQSLNVGMADNLFGKIDEVRISAVLPCNQFTISSTNQLIASVQALNLEAGVQNSLVSILQAVVTILGPDPSPYGPDPTPIGPDPSPFGPDPAPWQVAAAVNTLNAFINAVEAQSGRAITTAGAAALIADAQSGQAITPADADALIAVARQIIANLTLR